MVNGNGENSGETERNRKYFIGGTYVKVAGTGLELELPLVAALEKREKKRNATTTSQT